ncbi:hypothetical protein B296_00041273 [Ensete ventricosum]|uniref:Uncharacterized protein n=1 Tax=Ensete ventricosum TaxID=4639 RepID=A0A426Z3S9_ENSVE|nr:hypothetical protein B296_00041273 [Ensete ventricosum]
MEAADEVETKGSASPPPPDAKAAAVVAVVEAEGDVDERDRCSREIKAGLHPLKVRLPFSNFPSLALLVSNRNSFYPSCSRLFLFLVTSYEENIKKIVEFSTVNFFLHLVNAKRCHSCPYDGNANENMISL